LSFNQQKINDAIARKPSWKVEFWDILASGAPTIGAIIGGTADSSFMLDVTSFVNDGMSLEFPGDRRAAHLSLNLTDRTNNFDPHGGANSRYIKEGVVVRIKEGDLDLASADWLYTFTGHIRGQAGFSVSRDNLEKKTEISCYGRRATPKYNKMTFTGQNFGRSLDFGLIIQDIALNQMLLTTAEFGRVDFVLGRGTQFNSNQVVEMTPLEAIDKILEAVGKVSEFDGEGILRNYSRDVSRAEDKRYDDLSLIRTISVPRTDTDSVNSVSVIGLDKNLTEVENPDQELARANFTVGFWRPQHSVEVQWSKDRSTRAKDTEMQVIHSVNDSLILDIGTEEYLQLDDFSGRITSDISQYVQGLVFLSLIMVVLQAAIGDLVVGVGGGLTVPVGKILQAATQKIISHTMQLISTGEYLIKGTTLTPVYKEFSVKVTATGIPDFLLNEKEIRNDFINERNHALEIAQLELLFEHVQGLSREYEVVNDWEIEVGDIVFIPYAGGLRIWVDSYSKRFSRGEVPVMSVTGYRAL
jgi:hypothetical protein